MTAKEYLNQARHLDRAASQAVISNRTTIQINRQKPLLYDALRKSTPSRGMWRKRWRI